MTKIIHTADWHLGGAYPKKAEDSVRFLQHCLWEDKSSPAYDPDVVCITGDITDRALHLHSDHLQPLFDFVANSRCPIFILQGTRSHEPFGTVDKFQYLTSKTTHLPPVIFTKPDLFTFLSKQSKQYITIAALPAITKAGLYKWLGDECPEISGKMSIEETNGLVQDNIRNILRGFAAKWADFTGIKLLLGHLTVSGAKASTGQTKLGNDIEVGLDDLALSDATAVLLGHVHKRQEWMKPIPTFYSGSIYPNNWGELEEKSFNILHFDDNDSLKEWQAIPFPHSPMAIVNLEFTGERKTAGLIDNPESKYWDFLINGEKVDSPTAYFDFLANLPEKCELKVKYTVPNEIASIIDNDYILDLTGNEPEVTPERIIKPKTRDRLPDVGKHETTADKYTAWCKVTGKEPRPGSIEKANQLDEQGVIK